MILQYATLLLGGFSTEPVPEEDTYEAKRVLTLFNSQLRSLFKISVRPMNHVSIHIPEDVRKFKCRSECLSAYTYENFQMFFRNIALSGNKPIEQIRNVLIERFKYKLLTTSTGVVIDSKNIFESEIKHEAKKSGKKLVISWSEGVGKNPVKKIIFPSFIVSNKFPNNILMISQRSEILVVCVDIIKCEENVYVICGKRFRLIEDTFTSPFKSSKYNMFLASKLSNQ